MTPEEERQAWRMYAAAAFSVLYSRRRIYERLYIDLEMKEEIMCLANTMLAAEKERFSKPATQEEIIDLIHKGI